MAYNILIAHEKVWLKDISKLSQKELKLVITKIQELKNNPHHEGVQVKRLHHYDLADFRLRIGNYRILFDKDQETKTIILYRILHRSKLY